MRSALAPEDGLAESRLYHDTAQWGFVSLLQIVPGTHKKNQHSFLLNKLPWQIDAVQGEADVWLSQCEFRQPNRRASNLLRLPMLFTDLDTYRQEWCFPPEKMVELVRNHCTQVGLPQPSLIVFSGRGLQLKWLLTATIPSQALPRWNICQLTLVARLSNFGADPASRDASRVLRVPGTINSKSGELCRLLDVARDANQDPIRYCFEELCKILLPVARREIERPAPKPALKVLQGGLKKGLKLLNGRQLAWDRHHDLRKLRAIRGGVAPGSRMLFLFWQINFMALAGLVHEKNLMAESAELAREIDPTWRFHHTDLCTLRDKIIQSRQGKKIVFNGREYPPLYTPRNETLISIFQITSEEQRQLKTIISDDLAKERRRARDIARLRAAGAVDRETYLANALTQQEPWKALGMSRRTWYRLGKPEPGTKQEIA